VDHLKTHFKDANVVIMCIYCNYKDQGTQTVSNLVASLLKQMVQDCSVVSDNVKLFYNHHQDHGTRPTLEELTNALALEIRMYSKVFIVVDALDECPEGDGTRTNLLQSLRCLVGTVSLLATSRDLSSIAQYFDGTKRLNIYANDQDIRKYIEGRIASTPRRHLKALQETIVNEIIKNVQGMQVSPDFIQTLKMLLTTRKGFCWQDYIWTLSLRNTMFLRSAKP
jgi:hypothetical protein